MRQAGAVGMSGYNCRDFPPSSARAPRAPHLDLRLRTNEIRERFLTYFEHHGHHRLASASLITHDDPSLLFTVAGMVPLKLYITGQATPPSPLLVSCQKCFRGQGLTTDDIASVGDDTHHTFFEMLGNWSIGDYFKEGAITLAWQLLTEEFGLDRERLWPSIYPDDVESERIWREVGVPAERIARFADNWWQAGPTGPCGYDSEIYWDAGGPCSCGRADCRPDDDCGGDRWVEIWNLVLMEFNQDDQRVRSPLPRRTIDTGMGLERHGVRAPGRAQQLRDRRLRRHHRGLRGRAADAPPSAARTASLHVLADHVRAAAFLIADGVLPGTEARGYVLRRVIRRAAVHGRRVGLEGGLAPSVGAVVEAMGEAYPEIVGQPRAGREHPAHRGGRLRAHHRRGHRPARRPCSPPAPEPSPARRRSGCMTPSACPSR